jgi:uncharacterized membrane protein HdeD (DUF308 family)
MKQELTTRLWKLIMLQAVILLLAGVILLAYPETTLGVLFFIMGAYWLLDGILMTVKSIEIRKENSAWTLGLITGIIGMLAGLIVVLHPGFSSILTTSFFVWFLGLAALIYGIGGLVTGIRMKKRSKAGSVMIIAGIFSIIFGIILLASPYSTFITIVQILATFTIIGGLTLGYTAIDIRRKVK